MRSQASCSNHRRDRHYEQTDLKENENEKESKSTRNRIYIFGSKGKGRYPQEIRFQWKGHNSLKHGR